MNTIGVIVTTSEQTRFITDVSLTPPYSKFITGLPDPPDSAYSGDNDVKSRILPEERSVASPSVPDLRANASAQNITAGINTITASII